MRALFGVCGALTLLVACSAPDPGIGGFNTLGVGTGQQKAGNGSSGSSSSSGGSNAATSSSSSSGASPVSTSSGGARGSSSGTVSGGSSSSSNAASGGATSTGSSSGGTHGTSSSSSGAGSSSGASNGSSTGSSSSSSSGSAASEDAGTEDGGSTDPAEICVQAINQFRATINQPPLTRWTSNETCTAGQAEADSVSGVAHSAFGMCNELGQCECPGWPGTPAQMITQCLQQMWDEGPGGGHYDIMSSSSYTTVACGFYTTSDGSIWAAQDYQ